MSSELEDFLYQLADDVDVRIAFLRDPDKLLAETSLSTFEQATLKSRDAAHIREALNLPPVVPVVVTHGA